MAKKRPTTGRTVPTDPGDKPAAARKLLADLRELIESTRAGVAQAVNSALVILYWQVGHRIRSDVINNRRADYGEKILPTLSAKLLSAKDKKKLLRDSRYVTGWIAEAARRAASD